MRVAYIPYWKRVPTNKNAKPPSRQLYYFTEVEPDMAHERRFMFVAECFPKLQRHLLAIVFESPLGYVPENSKNKGPARYRNLIDSG